MFLKKSVQLSGTSGIGNFVQIRHIISTFNSSWNYIGGNAVRSGTSVFSSFTIFILIIIILDITFKLIYDLVHFEKFKKI